MLQKFVTGLLCLTMMLITACQTVAPAGTPPISSESATAEAAAEVSELRTVTDARGVELQIPAHPQRVVALSERDMDAVIALGANLVGVVNGRGSAAPPVYLQPYLKGVASVGAFAQPSAEAILNTDPDLILIGGLFPELEALLPQFEEIAPTFVTFNLGDDWQSSFLNAANALNKSAEAEVWLDNYNTRVEQIGVALGDAADTTVSIVRVNPDGPVIMAPASFASTVLQEVGLARPAAQMAIEGQGHSEPISLERLDQIDGDWLFISTLNPDGVGALQELQTQPIYQALTAVQNGSVSVVDGAVWTTLGGPLAAQQVLGDLTAAFQVSLPANDSNTATGDATTCRTITHDMGETEICGTPQKVVALGPHMLDLLLSLGVQPAGFAETQFINEEDFGKPVAEIAYLGPYVETMPINVGDRVDPNLEVLTLLKPDLILSELRDEDQLALLNQIAPTIAFRGNRADEWQRTIGPIAAALNIPQEAERVIAEHEAFIAAARAQLAPIVAEHPRLIFASQNQEGALATFTHTGWIGDLLADLGFELVFQPGDASLTATEVSVELMPTLPADLIIIGASSTATPALAEELWTGNPVLMALPASQAGRVYFVDYQLWSRLRGPITTRLVVEDLLRLVGE